jgi:methionyl-tRNA formyltransferase
VARIFRERGDRVAMLVLDHRDERGTNSAIREALEGLADVVVTDDALPLDRLADVDIALLAWWPRIIAKDVAALPRRGFLNFHPSLLPFNRGKHYNFWAIVEEAPFGVTIHWLGDQVDAGDIAFQMPVATSWSDNGKTLYNKARDAMIELFAMNYERIMTGDIPRTPQDLARGSFHRAAELDAASRIDLEKQYRGRDLLNVLRARTFPPHPAAWFVDDDEKYEVRVEIRKVENE